MAGFHNGVFFLRDYNDNFRLYVQGRAQVDAYTYFGTGVPDSSLKPTVLLRRIRPELTGEFMKYFQWMLSGDWGQTSVDNSNGKTNESSAAAPGGTPSGTSGRYAWPKRRRSRRHRPTFSSSSTRTTFQPPVRSVRCPVLDGEPDVR